MGLWPPLGVTIVFSDIWCELDFYLKMVSVSVEFSGEVSLCYLEVYLLIRFFKTFYEAFMVAF